MSYIFWSDEYLVGVYELDEQHKSLFELMNELIKSFDYEEADKDYFNVLNQLIKYAEKHFISEEEHLKKINYPRLKDHQRRHEQLVMQIFELTNKEVKNNYDTIGLVKFLKDWLCVHIKHEDMLYRSFEEAKIQKV